ncbi:polysaccharide biosynthesis/export family protein [Nitratidesulfovibrio vulgaris]|uniref:Polysaccharide export protein n=1 Tax=Nitratidesulfovibrio vulgaris (strain DP4) TaxID=391774 RepID=A0A0H3AB12_NITV4|nr:polysaccharide biosynthesis/export family protein [Nitratidesulfovibrio vulgaris]ABM29599.1 polysaccharide export protein [Nitratidesulfovibrio vulgaris DP4]
MDMKSKLFLSTVLLLALAAPSYAAEVSPTTSTSYGSSMGKSGNPSPSGSGGIQGTPSTRPPSYLPSGYQKEALYQQEIYRQELPSQREERQRQSIPGLPAWALERYHSDKTQGLEPFGANLFRGNFAGTYGNGMNDEYVIQPGDRITVRVWGARSYDDVLFVDQQGNIFLPEIGPVRVAGLLQSALLNTVRAKLASVFPVNVNIYVNLQSAQPVAVYVAGNVLNPGRYAAGPQDSVLSYLDRAGGILPEQGSYRNIRILRDKQTISSVDLYDYILRGELSAIRLKDGDTILVEPFGVSVAAYGLLRQPARYEFRGMANGKELLTYATPLNGVSHVSVGGIRNDEPFNVYVTLNDFQNMRLEDGDRVEFVADTRGKTIMVSASGAIHGASRFPVLKQTKLKMLLEYVAVEPELAAIKSIYIRRKSVAAEQKVILTDALRRLEQSALTASSSSVDEAGIRVKEAELIQSFVQRASKIEPDGVLVVSRDGKISDVLLEEGDEIIIPRRTDVVHISGEVLIPTAVTWEKGQSLKDYLNSAGGLSDRADTNNILIVGLNGEVSRAKGQAIEPGDRILVMPQFDSKNLQLVKDVTQVLYQMAVAVKVAVGL